MAAFDRDALTDILLAQIGSTDIYVGDHLAPKEGGWSTGMPGRGEFVAYTVLHSGTATFRDSTFVPGDKDVTAQYDLRCYGATRQQADDLALRAWQLLSGYKPGFGDYRVNRVHRVSLSGMQRIDTQDPKHWLVVDTYAVECRPNA